MPLDTMERHERYDPEDIESLLSERGFDELLPDERAFVLRHMSSREEYERMRALLHYVRPDERERGTIEAEDEVRTTVLAAFRAQQRPPWRIWLNGISLWLAPQAPPALWRPVLAFGSLAIVVLAGVVAIQRYERITNNVIMAELKQEETPATSTISVSEPRADQRSEKGGPASSALEQQRDNAAVVQRAEPTPNEVDSDDPTVQNDDLESIVHSADNLKATPPVETSHSFEAAPPSPSGMEAEEKTSSHVVTSAEMARNLSMTNATGAVAKEVASTMPRKKLAETDRTSASRSLAADPNVLNLIAAGW